MRHRIARVPITALLLTLMFGCGLVYVVQAFVINGVEAATLVKAAE